MNMYRVIVTAVVLVLSAAPFFNLIYGWTISVAALANFTAIALIGLNVIFGLLGLHALGQAAFIGVAGYSAGIMIAYAVPEVIALPVAVVVTLIVARLLAIIFVRLPGNYFAFGTIGFAFMIEGLARAFPDVTGGASGLVFSLPFPVSAVQWYIVSLVTLALAVLAYCVTVRGAYARRLHAVRSDELSAEILGIDVTRVKTNAFTIGGTFAAVSGLFLCYFVGVLVPESAGVERSLELVVMVMIGGAAAAWGPIAGAWLMTWLANVAGAIGLSNNFEVFIYGTCFFVASMFVPLGISGLIRRPGQNISPPVARSEKRLPAVVASLAAVDKDSPVLSVRDLTKSFGGIHAVSGFELDIKPGEVVVLIGPNGAGKTTVLNLLSGLEKRDAGQIVLRGEEISGLPVFARAKLMGRSFQVPRLVPELSVIENVLIRLDQLNSDLSEIERFEIAMSQLARFKLDRLAHAPISTLSAGQQKLIDVVRASLGASDLLLLDEPAVGLTAAELADLSSMIRDMRTSKAVIVVEHNFRFVEEIADRAIVLDRGKIISTGKLSQVTQDPVVRAAYYGALV